MGGRSRRVGVLYLALAVSAAGASGCAAVVIGGAAAGGALGYAYWRGAVTHEFPAGFPETWAATRAALGDLQLTAHLNPTGPDEGEITSRTADGDTITISLAARPGRLPADGATTAATVRVGVWGDRPLSEHIVARIQARLSEPPAGPSAPPAASGGRQPPDHLNHPGADAPRSPGVAPQTAPPPLADGPPAPR